MKKSLLGTLLFVGSLLAPTTLVNAAGNARISLSPSNGSFAQGSEFSTNVIINGTDINVVQIKITYDASALSCSSVSGSNVFSADIETNCSNGVVKVSRYTTGNPVSGSQQVASISFKALAESGSASIKVDGSSKLASSGNNVWDGTIASANMTFTAKTTAPVGGESPAPVAPTPTQSSTNTQTTNRTKSTAPKATEQANETVAEATTNDQPAEATTDLDGTSEVLGSTDAIAENISASNRSWTPLIAVVILVALVAAFVKPRYAEIKAKISEITSNSTK